MASAVAIIDIGSNSLKLLVAHRGHAGEIKELQSQTVETRISQGISQAVPRLGAEGMARGLTAIQTLLATAAPYAPVEIVLVAMPRTAQIFGPALPLRPDIIFAF